MYAQRWLNLADRNSTPSSSSSRVPGTAFFASRCHCAGVCQCADCAAALFDATNKIPPTNAATETLTLFLIKTSCFTHGRIRAAKLLNCYCLWGRDRRAKAHLGQDSR